MYIYGGRDIREGAMESLWLLDLNSISNFDSTEKEQAKKSGWVKVETTGKDHPGESFPF